MDFHRGLRNEEPEINLIPLIDVLLVIVIFLAVSTSYSKLAELQIKLAKAKPTEVSAKPFEVSVGITRDCVVYVDKQRQDNASVDHIRDELSQRSANKTDPIVRITADADARWQCVANVMNASTEAKMHVTFDFEALRGLRD
jgi:biopolymer transport protein ExbD